MSINETISQHPIPGTEKLAKLLPATKKIQVTKDSACSENLSYWLTDYKTFKEDIKHSFDNDKLTAKIKCCQIRAALIEYYQLINQNIDLELTAMREQVTTLNLSSYNPVTEKEQTPSLSKRAAFTVFALSLGFFEMIAGIAGMYEIILYTCSILNVAISIPVAGSISLLFGLISASVAAVFDIYAVAQAMKIPYLTACQELKSLINQSQKLIENNRQIKKSLNTINHDLSFDAPLETIQEDFAQVDAQLKKLEIIQAHVAMRITEYQKKIDASQTKRQLYQSVWVLLALPIYAGTVVIAANAAIGLLPTFGFPPIGLALATTFALLWVAVELYRFLSFERKHMVRGLDSLIFGSPENRFATMKENGSTMKEKLERNLSLRQQIEKNIESKQTNLQLMQKCLKTNILIFPKAEEKAIPQKIDALYPSITG